MACAPPSNAREIQSEVLAGTRTIGVSLIYQRRTAVNKRMQCILPQGQSSTAQLIGRLQTESRVL